MRVTPPTLLVSTIRKNCSTIHKKIPIFANAQSNPVFIDHFLTVTINQYRITMSSSSYSIAINIVWFYLIISSKRNNNTPFKVNHSRSVRAINDQSIGMNLACRSNVIFCLDRSNPPSSINNAPRLLINLYQRFLVTVEHRYWFPRDGERLITIGRQSYKYTIITQCPG